MSARVRTPLPAGLPVTDLAYEKTLLKSLTEDISDANYFSTLWDLARFYGNNQRDDLAAALIQIILESTNDPEKQATCYLGLGQIAEQRHEYGVAVRHYAKGLALRPEDKGVSYFLHNNMGYCLNLHGKHTEAERYCRLAIEIDSQRANAFKNLGLSLAGQNDLVGSAWAYVEAIKADARDPRAFHLLEKLVSDHPELTSQFPGVLRPRNFSRGDSTTVH